MATPASRAPLSMSASEIERMRKIQKQFAGPISLNVTTKECEKPQGGGGKGTETPYIVEVLLDGDVALQLNRSHFRRAGQMERFVALVNAFRAAL